MKKASKILFTISAVLSYIAAVIYIAGSVTLIVLALLPQFTDILAQAIENGTIRSDIQGTPEQIAKTIQGIFLIAGCISSPTFIFAIVSGIVSHLGVKKDSIAIYVLNIIFGFFSGVLLNTIGGILGLASYSDKKEENK